MTGTRSVIQVQCAYAEASGCSASASDSSCFVAGSAAVAFRHGQLVFWLLHGLRDHALADIWGGAKRPEYEVEHYPIPFSIGISAFPSRLSPVTSGSDLPTSLRCTRRVEHQPTRSMTMSTPSMARAPAAFEASPTPADTPRCAEAGDRGHRDRHAGEVEFS
jgi:hypothetical protein